MTRVIQLTEEQEAILARAQRLMSRLTDHEEQVVRLASSGLSTKEIAAQLGVSQKAVERRIECITAKARSVYGGRATFRGLIVAELRCLFFLNNF